MALEHRKHQRHDEWTTTGRRLALMRRIDDGLCAYFGSQSGIGCDVDRLADEIRCMDTSKDRVEVVIQSVLWQHSEVAAECFNEHRLDCRCEV